MMVHVPQNKAVSTQRSVRGALGNNQEFERQFLTSFWMALEKTDSPRTPRKILTSLPSRLTRTQAGRPPSKPSLRALS